MDLECGRQKKINVSSPESILQFIALPIVTVLQNRPRFQIDVVLRQSHYQLSVDAEKRPICHKSAAGYGVSNVTLTHGHWMHRRSAVFPALSYRTPFLA